MTPRPNPEPGQFWTTPKGRTVEILARDTVEQHEVSPFWDPDARIDTVAYQFLGGSMIHLRAVSTLIGWNKTDFE